MTLQEHSTVQHFQTLLRQRFEPLDMRVFGSRARGEAAADSDLDVLVIVETLDAATDRYVSECAWEAGFDAGIIVAPLVYSRDGYAREGALPLIRAIEREGEVIGFQ